MATCAIRKMCREGAGLTAVELGDVRHVFAAAVPRRGATLREQAGDALRTIRAMTEEEGASRSIVHQAVFLADAGQADACRRIMADFYGPDLPAISYIPQPPCSGKLLAIEAQAVGQDGGEVRIERPNAQVVVVRHNGIAWAHCDHVVPAAGAAGVYEGTASALAKMRWRLRRAGFRFDQVIRTWFYLGGIVADEGATQRYQELNRARADFYRRTTFLADRLPSDFRGHAYPASTGIGIQGRGIVLSAVAVATDRPDVVAVPLENPRQTSAFEYPDRYGPQSPKFSRAVALSCGSHATLFISGTASITHAETRHPGDATAQTDETLDNITALVSDENLCRHGLPGLGTTLDGLAMVRVYVKRQEDYARVQAVCQRRLGELPITYAIADVCRPELLVEIEGIAFSQKRADRSRQQDISQAQAFTPGDRRHSLAVSSPL